MLSSLCPNCNCAIEHSIVLSTLPNYLMVVVTRQSAGFNSINFVYPPMNLNMNQFMDTTCYYRLISSICHRSHWTLGHYVTYSKLPTQQWGLFNDKKGSIVKESKLLRENAYILIYKKYNREDV